MSDRPAASSPATTLPAEPLAKIAALLTEDIATGAGSLTHLIVDSPADSDADEFLTAAILVGTTVEYRGYPPSDKPSTLPAIQAAGRVIQALDVVDGDYHGADGPTYVNVVALERTLVELEAAVDRWRADLLAVADPS